VGALLLAVVFQLAGCTFDETFKPSRIACTQFLRHMQAHEFKEGYGLLSPVGKNEQWQGIRTSWASLEKEQGLVQSWSLLGSRSNTASGRSVTIAYTVYCSKGKFQAQFLCIEENDTSLIEHVSIG
jgi:hypothetical protein